VSGDEDFLSRWSRRKRESEATADESTAEEASKLDETENQTAELAGEHEKNKTGEGEAAEVPFDISKLPSIESITAETDIRPFLAAGVPAQLTQAALRKLWVADPKIRDFIEIAENQFDFNAGNILGFDFSLPENAQQMAADIVNQFRKITEVAGEQPKGDEASPALAQSSVSDEQITSLARRPVADSKIAPEESEHSDAEASEAESGDKTAQNDPVPQREENAELETPLIPRRHGSALPT
jgi:hypothetical protein